MIHLLHFLEQTSHLERHHNSTMLKLTSVTWLLVTFDSMLHCLSWWFLAIPNNKSTNWDVKNFINESTGPKNQSRGAPGPPHGNKAPARLSPLSPDSEPSKTHPAGAVTCFAFANGCCWVFSSVDGGCLPNRRNIIVELLGTRRSQRTRPPTPARGNS